MNPLKVIAAVALLSLPAQAQQTAFQDALLERLAGQWVLSGEIDGTQTTHDVIVEWVLGHGYIQMREVSREKSAAGEPAYEAIVYIGWDEALGQYACLWLDNTGSGGLSGQPIGYGKRAGDRIDFLFRGADGSAFHTTFAYDRLADTWQWLMDAEAAGKRQPFARVALRRKDPARGSVATPPN